MRETTRLSCAHIIEPISKMIQSFIMMNEKDNNSVHGFARVFETSRTGHYELEGVIVGNSIELVRIMVYHSPERMNYYIRFAKNTIVIKT